MTLSIQNINKSLDVEIIIASESRTAASAPYNFRNDGNFVLRKGDKHTSRKLAFHVGTGDFVFYRNEVVVHTMHGASEGTGAVAEYWNNMK